MGVPALGFPCGGFRVAVSAWWFSRGSFRVVVLAWWFPCGGFRVGVSRAVVPVRWFSRGGFRAVAPARRLPCGGRSLRGGSRVGLPRGGSRVGPPCGGPRAVAPARRFPPGAPPGGAASAWTAVLRTSGCRHGGAAARPRVRPRGSPGVARDHPGFAWEAARPVWALPGLAQDVSRTSGRCRTVRGRRRYGGCGWPPGVPPQPGCRFTGRSAAPGTPGWRDGVGTGALPRAGPVGRRPVGQRFRGAAWLRRLAHH